MFSIKLLTFLSSFFLLTVDSFNLEHFFQFDRALKSSSGISSQCLDELETIIKLNLTRSFLDASSKSLPDGLFDSNPFELGQFDECREIQVPAEGSAKEFAGQYCLGTIPLPNNTNFMNFLSTDFTPRAADFKLRTLASETPLTGIHVALCIPSGCSSDDLNNFFSDKTPAIAFDSHFCYSRDTDPELTTGAIVTIVIFALFVFIAALSTIYDAWLCYNKKEVTNRLLIAFSLYSNGKSLLKTTSGSGQLECLHGLRAISMAWVVIGHTYTNITNAPLGSWKQLINFDTITRNQWYVGATLSVDTFFVIAGLVLVYSFLNACERGVKFNIFMFYFHRYLRLTPVYLVVILIHLYLIPYFGAGPLYGNLDPIFAKPCREYWWAALLYVQVYLTEGGQECVPQSWYLSVDFQLFVFSPLVLVPLHRKPKFGLGLIGALLVMGVISPFLDVYYRDIPGSIAVAMTNMPHFMKDYYSAAYTRFGPYVIGIGLGYIIFLYKKKRIQIAEFPKIYVLAYWLVALAGLLSCVYTTSSITTKSTKLENAVFLAFDRNIWALAVAMVILACVTGYGGIVNTALSMPFLQFLAKLSYCMYLVHYFMITFNYSIQRTPIFLNEYLMLMSFFGFFTFSVILAIPFSLIFESPIIILEKLMFQQGKREDKSKEAPSISTLQQIKSS